MTCQKVQLSRKLTFLMSSDQNSKIPATSKPSIRSGGEMQPKELAPVASKSHNSSDNNHKPFRSSGIIYLHNQKIYSKWIMIINNMICL